VVEYRIREHPILPVPARPTVEFYWQDRALTAFEGETISSALFAGGVRVFGHHPKDGAPQGIFCANGQCAQCTVIADGLPVKSCMVPVRAGMRVAPLDGKPVLPDVDATIASALGETAVVDTECLIVGGGPAGLTAAIELGRAGVRTLIVDDKHRLGGKLVLQTHKFFGSIDACYAGTRGIDIATRLENDVRTFENVRVWLNSTALSVFSDRRVGIIREGRYVIVRPEVVLVAAGAREKSLVFKGNTLPGVYGAGAFQTLVNRDLVRPTSRLFIIGGGNVGLIAGYHALQAGIEVVGLCEALPECGGYKVHTDKLVRMGVPVYTSHTVLSANGGEEVTSVTIAKIDARWKPIPGTEKTFACDTVLVAVGLEPVDEFTVKAREFGLPVYAAGDSEEIAEASAAMFTGRIRGLEIARALGRDVGEVPPEWHRTAEVLKSRPGATVKEDLPEPTAAAYPVFHCSQEIPCNPCTSICPQHGIRIEGDDLMGLPEFVGQQCDACEMCVAICPGLAVTLVDFRKNQDMASVTIPYEFTAKSLKKGDVVTVLDTEGTILGNVEVTRVREAKVADRCALVRVKAPREIATRIAGIRVQEPWVTEAADTLVPALDDEMIVCRCERVTAGEIRQLIRAGVRDMNELKAITRAGMGACGGKTCPSLIKRLFREEGVPDAQITDLTKRPLIMEVPLGAFAGLAPADGPPDEQPKRHATDAHEGGL
jgi:NADPH-dependent 2,4-dienoyl-CoA reductase/sulfur reductase-like enzyme/Pyruvate/2-oxoacid:ferredoxin oxidoreductase delta subunit/bacterioferritin-associated ferredoxin